MNGNVPNANTSTLCPEQNAFLNEQLTRANDSRLHQDQIFWVVFSIAFGANALILGALSQISNKTLYHGLIELALPAFGLVLSIGWIVAQYRIIYYYFGYEKLVKSLEDKLMGMRLPYSNDDDIRIMAESRYPPSKFKLLIYVAPVIFAIFWGWMLFHIFTIASQ